MLFMKKIKEIICIILTILSLAGMSCTAYAASDNFSAKPGQTMPDFTVQLTDGTSAVLSELLKENDLVVLNVFATWCNPCKAEFPEMEKVYEANSDRMVILSVSTSPGDTMQMVADYKAARSLTFPMGLAGDALDFLNVDAYPTTYFITHDGMIGFVKVGAFVGEGAFEEKVNAFLSQDYDGTPLPSDTVTFHFSHLFILILVSVLMLVIGRWRLFRKAGRSGWQSLIPILATYREFSIAWKGRFGIFVILCQAGSAALTLFSSHENWTVFCTAGLIIVSILLKLLESIKLAKAFGRGIVAGILLAVFEAPGRFILSLSKAKYRGSV